MGASWNKIVTFAGTLFLFTRLILILSLLLVILIFFSFDISNTCNKNIIVISITFIASKIKTKFLFFPK